MQKQITKYMIMVDETNINFEQKTQESDNLQISNGKLNKKNDTLSVKCEELEKMVSIIQKDKEDLVIKMSMQVEEKLSALEIKLKKGFNDELYNKTSQIENLDKKILDYNSNEKNWSKVGEEKNSLIVELTSKIGYLEKKNERVDVLEKDVFRWKNSYEETKNKINELLRQNKEENHKNYETKCNNLKQEYETIIEQYQKQADSTNRSKSENGTKEEKYKQ